MPPKTKFTKEEIVNASLGIASKYGINEIKAREVGKALGCSSRPIFTFFEDMESLKKETTKKAFDLFYSYLKIADGYTPSFKMRGMQMIRFAKDEPRLFEMLFMTHESPKPFDVFIKERMTGYETDIKGITSAYGITREEAEHIFGQLWIHAYGICVICVTGGCNITEKDYVRMLGRTFEGEMLLVKSASNGISGFAPVPNGSDDAAFLSKPFTEIGDCKSQVRDGL